MGGVGGKKEGEREEGRERQEKERLVGNGEERENEMVKEEKMEEPAVKGSK